MLPAFPPETPGGTIAPPLKEPAEKPARTGGWRWETSTSLACVLLLPWWACVTGLNTHPFWEILLAIILGVGIGFALSGIRRGSSMSRSAAQLCLGFHLLATSYAVGHAVWLRWFEGR